MSLDIEWRPEVGKKVESFFASDSYKDYLESAVSFNRKLNEERKMRLPYIDGQTGVAQRHYNIQKSKRERMPGLKPGQVYSYPQRQWKKKKYQYLRYFMYEQKLEAQQAELLSLNQMEINQPGPGATGSHFEDSNTSASGNAKDDPTKEWSYYDDMFPEGDDVDYNSDSDFEYEDSYSKKKNKSGKKSKGKGDARYRGSGFGGNSSKRRSNADIIPESEKPFHCDFCGIRYKTRPGLNYHIKTSHKDKDTSHLNSSPVATPGIASYVDEASNVPIVNNGHMMMSHQVSAPVRDLNFAQASNGQGGVPFSTSLAVRGSSRRTTQLNYNEDAVDDDLRGVMNATSIGTKSKPRKVIGPDGVERAISLGYCDFCLGDVNENKKTNLPEELVGCAECGRSGHPSCLQFTRNMLISSKGYAWQCIECKCCSVCGTAENDDQLLFCDDCDRGYHMYCLVPKMREPPEGSWSCKLCVRTFHS